VFQIGPSAMRRAAALARSCKDGSPRGIGVLHSTETGQRGLGARFAAAAESLGLPVVWRDTYAPGAEDFRGAIRAMTAQRVDMLFWDGDSREADALLRQLAQERIAVKLCGGEELSPEQYHSETRAMLEGARHVAEDWQVSTRTMARLDSVARGAGEERAGPLYVRGYLTGRFIAAAVRQGALCPEELAAALAARVERGDLRFLDCAAEGAQLPVYSVTRGRSVAGAP
jgi:ABC-type branched-subunit amino acid transport system substrate-binding protein